MTKVPWTDARWNYTSLIEHAVKTRDHIQQALLLFEQKLNQVMARNCSHDNSHSMCGWVWEVQQKHCKAAQWGQPSAMVLWWRNSLVLKHQQHLSFSSLQQLGWDRCCSIWLSKPPPEHGSMSGTANIQCRLWYSDWCNTWCCVVWTTHGIAGEANSSAFSTLLH
jgi:hypothetical protein